MAWQTKSTQLVHAVAFREKTYTHITLHEPSVAALEAIEAIGFVKGQVPSVAQTRAMVAALSSEPEEVILMLHRDDFYRIAEGVDPLLSGAPPEGGAPSQTLSSPTAADTSASAS